MPLVRFCGWCGLYLGTLDGGDGETTGICDACYARLESDAAALPFRGLFYGVAFELLAAAAGVAVVWPVLWWLS